MKRGRVRRDQYRKTRHKWGGTWRLPVLTAAALICGIVGLWPGKEMAAEDARVSVGMPAADPAPTGGQEAGPAPEEKAPGHRDGGEAGFKQEEAARERRVLVVDVNDVEAVEIPAGWAGEADDGAIRAALEKRVSEIAAKWNRNPVDSQMEAFDKETGTYRYTQEVYGRALDEGRLAEELFRAVMAGKIQGSTRPEDRIQAVFLPVPPNRTREQAKEQYKVIGTFTTTTTNNKNRNQNIRLAADAIDGLVLKPGQEFSFNMATGNRTSEKGYQPAGAYRNGVLIEEPGGGVCQVSTTLYHAIIRSGFKTTERNFHSFAPAYIEKGQDAMVSFDGYAGPDLRFVNTSAASMGLRASFSDNKLKLSIVGLPVLEDGKTVSMRSEKVRDVEPPKPVYEENPGLAYGEEKVIEPAQPGSEWKTYRQVRKNGELLEETALHTSTYKAKAARIQRNSAALPPGEASGQDGGNLAGAVQDDVSQGAGLQDGVSQDGGIQDGGSQEAENQDMEARNGTGLPGQGQGSGRQDAPSQDMAGQGLDSRDMAGPGNAG